MRISALLVLMLISFTQLGIGSLGTSNESVESSKEVLIVKDLYFVDEEIEVFANFIPEKAFIIDPLGKELALLFEPSEKGYIAKLNLKRDVILGEYRLIVDEFEKSFIVDFCELNVSYYKGFLNITAKTFFSKPKIEYRIDSQYGEALDNVSIPVKAGKHDFEVLCGKNSFKGNFEVNFSVELREGRIYA
ncbi:MAG: hypothetical protein N3D09_01450, partial [Archaeoglobaceae archaeon]|nr:hypothetical protein [Archaeoglobaceae archaeon]